MFTLIAAAISAIVGGIFNAVNATKAQHEAKLNRELEYHRLEKDQQNKNIEFLGIDGGNETKVIMGVMIGLFIMVVVIIYLNKRSK